VVPHAICYNELIFHSLSNYEHQIRNDKLAVPSMTAFKIRTHGPFPRNIHNNHYGGRKHQRISSQDPRGTHRRGSRSPSSHSSTDLARKPGHLDSWSAKRKRHHSKSRMSSNLVHQRLCPCWHRSSIDRQHRVGGQNRKQLLDLALRQMDEDAVPEQKWLGLCLGEEHWENRRGKELDVMTWGNCLVRQMSWFARASLELMVRWETREERRPDAVTWGSWEVHRTKWLVEALSELVTGQD